MGANIVSNFLDLLHLKCAKNVILTLQLADVKVNGLISIKCLLCGVLT